MSYLWSRFSTRVNIKLTENYENSSSNENSEKIPTNSDLKDNTPDHKSSEYVDRVLSRQGAKVIDSETLIKETQKRVWASLKQGYE